MTPFFESYSNKYTALALSMGVIRFFTMPRKRARKFAHKLGDQSFFYDMGKYLVIFFI